MLEVGAPAPDFTVPIVRDPDDDVEEFTLSCAVGDGPIVLAFYPAAFTGGCTAEMCRFQDSIGLFEDLDAQVYGVSVDLPFAQQEWMRAESLTIPMLSDWDHRVIRLYGVVREDLFGMMETAQRAIFVVGPDGVLSYTWLQDENSADFETVVSRTRDAVADVARS